MFRLSKKIVFGGLFIEVILSANTLNDQVCTDKPREDSVLSSEVR